MKMENHKTLLTITKATGLEKESFNMLFEFLDPGENSCKLKCVSVCVCVCVFVCLCPFTVKASSVWISWSAREQINNVVL